MMSFIGLQVISVFTAHELTSTATTSFLVPAQCGGNGVSDNSVECQQTEIPRNIQTLQIIIIIMYHYKSEV